MPFKKFTVIISALVLAGLFLSTGYIAGRIDGKKRCIATVDENCEYICGVGADFYFPDEEDREFNNIEDTEQDSMIARKGIKARPLL